MQIKYIFIFYGKIFLVIYVKMRGKILWKTKN